MSFLLLVMGGFIAAMILSEIVLKNTKLQTGLGKVMMAHAVVAGGLLGYLVFSGRSGWLALLIFWAGAFLTWFGVRSHMESSILLRMLFLLRKGSIPENRLIEDYQLHYGEQQRLEELYRGRMLQKTEQGTHVTPKGKFILRIVSILK